MASAALKDKIFLKKLDEFQLREIYVKIISLTLDENPLDEIQGRATAGSINIDGNSAVRRTCSLTLLVDDLELRDYYWGLKTKFRLEVGMKNFIDSSYEDIIWFPQGTYVVTSFNTSQNATGYTVSEDGLKYTFTLRHDVKWVDAQGAEVATLKADDFVAGFQQVTIVHSGELKREPTGGSELARRLVPLFNKEEEAMKFPERIRGMKNQEITKLVNVLWEKGVISSDTKPTDFWRVLHELGFYTASDRNWNDQVFFVKRR